MCQAGEKDDMITERSPLCGIRFCSSDRTGFMRVYVWYDCWLEEGNWFHFAGHVQKHKELMSNWICQVHCSAITGAFSPRRRVLDVVKFTVCLQFPHAAVGQCPRLLENLEKKNGQEGKGGIWLMTPVCLSRAPASKAKKSHWDPHVVFSWHRSGHCKVLLPVISKSCKAMRKGCVMPSLGSDSGALEASSTHSLTHPLLRRL